MAAIIIDTLKNRTRSNRIRQSALDNPTFSATIERTTVRYALLLRRRQEMGKRQTEEERVMHAYIARQIEDLTKDSEILAELTRFKERSDISDIFVWLKGWTAIRVAKALFELDWEIDDILRLLTEKWPRQRAIDVLVPLCFDIFVANPNKQVVIMEEMRDTITLPERREALNKKARRYNSTFCGGLTEE